MCLANMANTHTKMLDKIRLSNPLAKRLEQETGIRPHAPGFMIGKREGNLFYQKGGKGYAGDPGSHLTRPTRTLHAETIARRRANMGG